MSTTHPNVTASGLYGYGDILLSRTVDEWVQVIHKYNCKQNNWNYNPLKKGSYGYDNLVYSLIYAISAIKEDITDNELAVSIHQGWTDNYLYWRDNAPYETRSYQKPYKPLGDERRNYCASRAYEDLSQEEKDKDLFLTRTIIELYYKKG